MPSKNETSQNEGLTVKCRPVKITSKRSLSLERKTGYLKKKTNEKEG